MKNNLLEPTQINELVTERLRTIPEELVIHVGDSSLTGYSKEQLIEEVNRNSDLGKRIVAAELDFLQSLKETLINSNE